MSQDWQTLQETIIGCARCPRLRAYCKQVARTKRAAYRDWTYWGKPVPNFGEPSARLLIVGLAPAAHGANRTGRMFTGDRSGEFLYRALYETGFATQPEARHREDGLRLTGAVITAVLHCAPPLNKPLPEEIANCIRYLEESVRLMPSLRGIVALGQIAFQACLQLYRQRGWLPQKARLEFRHHATYTFPKAPFLIASYHPSQQNTFTRKLTLEMLIAVFRQAKELVEKEG